MLSYSIVDSTVTRPGAECRGNRMILFSFWSRHGTHDRRSIVLPPLLCADGPWDEIYSSISKRGGQIVDSEAPGTDS